MLVTLVVSLCLYHISSPLLQLARKSLVAAVRSTWSNHSGPRMRQNISACLRIEATGCWNFHMVHVACISTLVNEVPWKWNWICEMRHTPGIPSVCKDSRSPVSNFWPRSVALRSASDSASLASAVTSTCRRGYGRESISNMYLCWYHWKISIYYCSPGVSVSEALVWTSLDNVKMNIIEYEWIRWIHYP